MANPILKVTGLSKSFGGVRATNHVNLDVYQGETHALIGPNGAGKTTLISQLSGLLQPDQGQIIFNGENITGLPPHKFSQAGLARSFQITSVFTDMTLLDNIALAIQAHDGHSFKFWQNARRDTRLRQPANVFLQRVGLNDRDNQLASEVSHGERRQLEIAMALATEPSLLLLDEPMAGMGQDESTLMINILRQLHGEKSILLVEHDMDAVFALADRISVLVYGEIIASGTPEEIKSNPEVQKAYLGEESI
ncbi:ABC transporter ATP-binding protein [Chromatiales bacterium (ex Bugula neritina AB1)]|nr:ABC transporter ATP-binding protein [Chromatiales bacterium (ex Bugula neritina AB1)]